MSNLLFINMLKKRTALLASLTGLATISALGIIAIAFLTCEDPAPLKTQPSAQLPPAPAIAQPPALPEEYFEDDIDSKLVPLALENPLDDQQEKEGVLSFATPAAYQAFLSSLDSKGLRLIAQSNTLLSVRVGFTDISQLEGIEAEISPNYTVTLPLPPETSAQPDALGFQGSALRSIGITTDNSLWGSGVLVAVIDSGVNDHIALKEGITHLNLTELSDESEQLSHGTAVASIISGDLSKIPGVAPASDILSIRITDNNGVSDSFTLAEGIIAAADNGAQIINISMGASAGSAVLARAVSYAQSKGAVIVASAGNEGASQLSYPAAYPSVISVGAIEANGQHLHFSNQSDALTLSAPGFEVYAAWEENQLTGFSGTSASAPFVSGAIAAILSENPNLTPQQATTRLLQYTNEGGLPGADSQYGVGTLALGRALAHDTPGIYDIAITSQLLQTDARGQTNLLVVIQNQGTETLFNSPATISTPQGTTQLSINSLTPGSTYLHTVPLPLLDPATPLAVTGSVGLSTQQDADPANNAKQSVLSPQL